MILSNVNIGSGPSAGDGDPLRTAFNTINQNFAQIESNVNSLSNSVTSVAGRTGNITLTVNDIVGFTSATYPNVTVINGLINTAITNLVDGAPGVLDTLNELAAALGDDSSFSTTILSNIATLTSNAGSQAQAITTIQGNISSLQANAQAQQSLIANLQAVTYGNSNVAAYLPTYAGNVRAGNIIFDDLSVQTTAYTGAQWRSNLTTTLTSKPTWLSYVPGGKNQEGVQYGFDATGMFFAGNADNDFAYPVQTNLRFHENETVEIIATIRFSQANNDHGIAIFSADTRPIWRAGADVSRIAFQFDAGIPVLYGQTTANTAPGIPLLSPGNWYTVKFGYNPGVVTVETFAGNVASGSAIDVRTINETLPAGDYSIGFDADIDSAGVKSYFTNLIVRTFTDSVVNDLEVRGTATVGNIIPSANVTYSLGNVTHQWKDLWVSNNTIYINSVPVSIDNSGALLVNGNAVSGSTTLPYVEVTNSPFIIQPVTFGSPVTVTAPVSGQGATVEVVIGAGPVIDSLTIVNAGTGYVVGQRYKVWYYNVGGNDLASDVIFEIATVGELGNILTVTTPTFAGVANNTPGTYNAVSIELISSVRDEISPGVVLTRGVNQALYNIAVETEYDNNTYSSPLATEWNADGWDNLVGIGNRSFTTFRSALGGQVGNNVVGAELVMRDTTTDKYYKFDFTNWGQNNGGSYSYTRTEITDPNYFVKTDNGEEIDVFVADDGDGAGVGITRDANNGIYNPYREGSWDSDVSPGGTEWNVDGWDDLSDVESRTYTNFYAAYGNGQLGNRVPGSQAVMYVPDTDKYYAIQWLNWTQGGNGGGFSYVRYELDLTKLNEGIKFTDGTVLKSAEGLGRVKSTAIGSRRIEEVSGYKSVTVTGRVTQAAITGTSYNTITNDWYVYLTWDQDLYNLYNGPTNFSIEISFDNSTWYNAEIVGSSTNNFLQIYLIGNIQVSVNTGDNIYYRTSTGADPVIWWNKSELPGGSSNFRGAVIDYHAFTGESTIIGTIHIVDDDGEEHITHTEVSSGSTDGENDDLWLVQNEGTISYRRIDGEAKTLKIHWTAKVFYGSEYYDD